MTSVTELLGLAVFYCWADLPRDVQETLFSTAAVLHPPLIERLAIELHDRHPRTMHPPRPMPSV